MVNAYDEVAYPSAVYSRTHPDHIAAIAMLSQLEPMPTERCRVLELGCGDGCNLLSLAYGMPGSQFVGLDLATEPVARGTAMIEKLGLKNIALQTRDVTTIGPAELGEFDYIIAHGLYSWVPAAAREKIMELCATHLSARGIAYISYNAYPGNHIRDLTRGMIRYHASHFTDPRQRLAQARGILKLAAGAGAPTDLYRHILVAEDERVSEASNGHFFHDDLNSYNQPFYFHEFMAHARRHGLQFLSEADITDRREPEYSPEAQAALAQLDPDDVVTSEQYRDFLRGRTFRRTLLCREGIPLHRALDITAMSRLFFAGKIESTGVTLAEDAEPETEVFQNPGQARFETSQPLVKAALRRIGAAWPRFLSFPILLEQVQQDLEASEALREDRESDALATAILDVAIAGGLELRTRPPRFAPEPGPRPTASALARLQVASGTRIPTLLHQTVELDDTFSRRFVGLLDGTRNRSELRLAAMEAAGGATEGISEEQIEQVLRRMARLGLLEA